MPALQHVAMALLLGQKNVMMGIMTMGMDALLIVLWKQEWSVSMMICMDLSNVLAQDVRKVFWGLRVHCATQAFI